MTLLSRLVVAPAYALYFFLSAANAQSALLIAPLAEKKVAALPAGTLFWRIENFPARSQAQVAASTWSLVAEAAGKVWLFPLGPAGGASAGGHQGSRRWTHRAGRCLAIPTANQPSQRRTGQRDSGAYPSGLGSILRSRERAEHSRPPGVMRVRSGQPEAGHGADMPMQVSGSGSTDLQALVMFVVDADKPFSSPATFP